MQPVYEDQTSKQSVAADAAGLLRSALLKAHIEVLAALASLNCLL